MRQRQYIHNTMQWVLIRGESKFFGAWNLYNFVGLLYEKEYKITNKN